MSRNISELKLLLPAALIFLAISVEFLFILYLRAGLGCLFLLWGISIYVCLLAYSWIMGENNLKRNIAVGFMAVLSLFLGSLVIYSLIVDFFIE